MKEHVPAALGTYLCPRVSPGETTWFLECGFILHPMANAVIRAVSSVKGLKQEQRRLFLGTLGQCWAPYQVLPLLGVLTFHVQNAKGGSLPRGRRRAKWWKNRAWVWQEFLESHVLPVWFLFVCLFLKKTVGTILWDDVGKESRTMLWTTVSIQSKQVLQK